MDYLNQNFDKAFKKIEGLMWLPWVGDLYEECKPENRVMVLGESTYDWSHEGNSSPEVIRERQGKDDFNRVMVGKSHGLNKDSSEKIFRNFERAFFEKRAPHFDLTHKFWRSVVFHNLVLRPMPNQNIRPSCRDYINGWKVFFDLIEVVSPAIVVFAGTDMSKVETFHEVAKERGVTLERQVWRRRIGRSKAVCLKASTSTGKSFQISFIKHPSMCFSWKNWGSYLLSTHPDYVSKLRTSFESVFSTAGLKESN